MYSRHEEHSAIINASAERVFDRLDGPYRMGFDLMPDGATVQLRVTIDYELPAKGISRLLGRLFGRSYAKWCTRQMVRDTQHSFAP